MSNALDTHRGFATLLTALLLKFGFVECEQRREGCGADFAPGSVDDLDLTALEQWPHVLVQKYLQ